MVDEAKEVDGVGDEWKVDGLMKRKYQCNGWYYKHFVEFLVPKREQHQSCAFAQGGLSGGLM